MRGCFLRCKKCRRRKARRFGCCEKCIAAALAKLDARPKRDRRLWPQERGFVMEHGVPVILPERDHEVSVEELEDRELRIEDDVRTRDEGL